MSKPIDAQMQEEIVRRARYNAYMAGVHEARRGGHIEFCPSHYLPVHAKLWREGFKEGQEQIDRAIREVEAAAHTYFIEWGKES